MGADSFMKTSWCEPFRNPSLCLALDSRFSDWIAPCMNDAFPAEGGGVGRARIR